ncbi:PRPF6, partial [Symbiodinium pilosum]
TSPVIWVTAAKLEETQGNEKMVELILTRAIDSLAANGVTPDRDMWLKQAEEAEKTGFIKTCQAIIKVTIKVGVDEDVKGMKQNWIQDADAAINRNSIEVARAIYNNAVMHLKGKKGLWLRLAELETKYGNAESLDNVLQRAVTYCPHAEILWLMAPCSVQREQWRRMRSAWFSIFTKEDFKPKSIIQLLCKQTKTLKYGQVDRVLDGSSAFVKIADGVFMVVTAANTIWSFVPNTHIDKAKKAVSACWDAARILSLTSVEGVKIVVTSVAAEGLCGAASVTSGLATLGGGSVAGGGLGMVGGIFVVAAAPSVLSAHAIYNLCDAMENNSLTPTAVAIGGVGGAVAGSTLLDSAWIGIVMVAESGAVAGLSASGITSGLAALGGGSIASGGAGVLGGVAAVASGAAVYAHFQNKRALHLSEEGLKEHPSFAKLWMIGGQIHMEKSQSQLTDFADAGGKFDSTYHSQGLLLKALYFPGGQQEMKKRADLLWLKGVEVSVGEFLALRRKYIEDLSMKAEEREMKQHWKEEKRLQVEQNMDNAYKLGVDALKKCENDAHVIIAVAKLFWRDGKNAKARKWFNRAVTLNPRLGDAWGAYLAFELENGTSHEQREVIRKCVDAEPNQGLEWNKIVKKVANWRAKWAVKLKRFVEEVYTTEFNAKPLNREVELLLQGEDPYAAMATAQEEAAAEKDELDVKDEGGVKQESFEPATSFQGAKPGWCFKMGMRGLGYYRDPKQDQAAAGIKGEVKQEGKAKVKEEDEKK